MSKILSKKSIDWRQFRSVLDEKTCDNCKWVFYAWGLPTTPADKCTNPEGCRCVLPNMSSEKTDIILAALHNYSTSLLPTSKRLPLSCNYCEIRRLESDIGKNWKVTRIPDPFNKFEKGERIFVHPKNILPTERHFKMWCAEIPSECKC